MRQPTARVVPKLLNQGWLTIGTSSYGLSRCPVVNHLAELIDHLCNHGNLNYPQKLPSPETGAWYRAIGRIIVNHWHHEAVMSQRGGIRWPWCSVRLLSLECARIHTKWVAQWSGSLSTKFYESKCSQGPLPYLSADTFSQGVLVFFFWGNLPHHILCLDHTLEVAWWVILSWFELIHTSILHTLGKVNEWRAPKKWRLDFGIFATDIQGLEINPSDEGYVHPDSTCWPLARCWFHLYIYSMWFLNDSICVSCILFIYIYICVCVLKYLYMIYSVDLPSNAFSQWRVLFQSEFMPLISWQSAKIWGRHNPHQNRSWGDLLIVTPFRVFPCPLEFGWVGKTIWADSTLKVRGADGNFWIQQMLQSLLIQVECFEDLGVGISTTSQKIFEVLVSG